MEGSFLTLSGVNPGKRVVILAGIHGNETCGVEAFGKMSSLKIDSGRVDFIIGNPRAVAQKVRFAEVNLNRMFRSDESLTESERASYEYRRSRELIPILTEADAVLDIHSSGTPGSPAFVICEPHSFEIVQRLPFSTICYNWDAHQPGGTDYFMNQRGRPGICIECGYHEDARSIDRAVQSIIAFLTSLNMKPSGVAISTTEIHQQQRIAMRQQYKTITDFRPARSFHDFEKITAGELLGRDGAATVCAQEDGVIIFVRERKNPNEEAFLFGKLTAN